MALINPLIGSNLVTGAAPFTTTLIPNSVWLDGSADGLTAPSSTFSAEDGKEFTLGTWFQLTEFSVTGALFCADAGSNVYTSLRHGADNKIFFQTEAGSAILSTSNLYRDIGWYHLLLSVDTTQSTASNRVRLFINGEEVTLSGTQPSVNHVYEFNLANKHEVGDSFENGAFEGYLAQSFMIGSKSIQQGDFAITDFLDTYTFGTNGSQFIPKKHSEIKTLVDAGSSNSFLLQYENSGALGTDSSTNTNTFTATSMGSANQSTNTPSKTYSIFNPLAHADNSYPGSFTLSEGNQKNVIASGSSGSNTSVKTTLPFVMDGSNIIRAQFTFSTLGDGGCGITGSSHTAGTYHTAATSVAGRGEVGLCGNGALVIDGNFNNSYTSALSNGDVVDVIVNLSVGAVYFAVDGTLLGGATQSEIQAGTTTNAALVSSFVRRTAGEVFNFYAFQFNPSSTTIEYNSGQSSFTHSYSTITSLISLNTADLPAPDYQGIDYFDTTLYEGNGTGQRVGDFVPVTDVGTITRSFLCDGNTNSGTTDLTISTSVSTAPTDVQVKTLSFWIKPVSVREQHVYNASTDATDSTDSSERIYIATNGEVAYQTRQTGSAVAVAYTAGAEINDASQWYNVVVALNYDSATAAANTLKIYVNGVEQTLDNNSGGSATLPSPGMTTEAYINKASTRQLIGTHPGFTSAGSRSNCYLAEMYMVDGQALDASAFGVLDTSTNRWVPKAPATIKSTITGTGAGFGGCGFYLDFLDASDLGDDDSGNNRDFTESATIGTENQVADSPSINFATIDTVFSNGNTPVTLSEGNLTGVRSSSGFQQAYSNFSGFRMQENTGIYFAEVLMGADSSNFSVGVLSGDPPSSTNRYLGQDSNTYGYAYDSGNKVNDGTGASYGATYTSGDVIGIEIDTDTGSINFHKNGADQGQAFTGVPGPYSFAFDTESGGGPMTFNFGQQLALGGASTTFNAAANGNFKHTPPTGAKALNQDNLDDTSSKLTAWSWIKNRDATDSHILVDRVRGVGEVLHSDLTDLEATEPNTVQRFFQRGVQVGNDVQVNTANESYVLWQWLVGEAATTTTINASSTTPTNSIASTVAAADAGHFSVVGYQGNSTNGATVAHSLGGEPELIFFRGREGSGASSFLWRVFSTVGGAGKYLRLHDSTALQDDTGYLNNTLPGSVVFTLGTDGDVNNSSYTYIAYCFRSVPGVCKVGSYIGNGDGTGSDTVDGPYVNCGFRPRWILFKWATGGSLSGEGWVVKDTARQSANPNDDADLIPNGSNAEAAGATHGADILSDGFKLRGGGGAVNKSGATYLYMAIADIGGNGTLPPIYGR